MIQVEDGIVPIETITVAADVVLRLTSIPRMAAPTAKIRRQKRNSCRYTGFPVFQYSPCRTHKNVDNPTVIDGNVIWNNTVLANCPRERSSRLNSASQNACGPRSGGPVRSRRVLAGVVGQGGDIGRGQLDRHGGDVVLQV
jgi:hypothetical protein